MSSFALTAVPSTVPRTPSAAPRTLSAAPRTPSAGPRQLYAVPSLPAVAPGATSSEAHAAAALIASELRDEAESRRLRRATERHRERIVTGITVAACTVAAGAAITFAQLLVIVR